jgi:hypothetical protein
MGQGAICLAMLAGGAAARAETIELSDGFVLDFGGTATYSLGIRAEDRDSRLTDPNRSDSANANDGDFNFDQGALINNRAALVLEGGIHDDNVGVFVRGSAFYDDAYRNPNDNAPGNAVNKFGPADEFTDETQDYHWWRVRLLDAYAYGRFELADMPVDLRAGRQVVSWGESLFFPNIAGSQNPYDVTKLMVPGAEVKDYVLPTLQASARISPTPWLSFAAYYQFEFEKNELDGVGSYFSYSDIVGPGAEFLDALVLTVQRHGDAKARDMGQWGLSAHIQVGDATDIGLYGLVYHDKAPTLAVTSTLLPVLPFPPFFVAVPTSYRLEYYEDITLLGASFTTGVGNVTLAGEVSYRDGAPVMVDTPLGFPMGTPGRLVQGNLSFVNLLPVMPWADSTRLLGEVTAVHVLDVDTAIAVPDNPYMGPAVSTAVGIDDLTFARTSAAIELQVEFGYTNVFDGWDMSVPVTYQGVIFGPSALPGSLGPLVGIGDHRLSLGVDFTYLNNLEIGLRYNFLFGEGDTRDRPLADRDYATLAVSYGF